MRGINIMLLNAQNLNYRELNDQIRACEENCQVTGTLGQRFICAGMKDKHVTIDGIPGNALGAYLNGGVVIVRGNAQDAVGDTMNDGKIVIHGNIGDAAGYAMRGGKIFVKGDAGYRAGIHMKAYREKRPVMVVGGKAGSFLGEYQAGGVIIVLGLGANGKLVGNFPCTGMHGGKMYLRGNCDDVVFPSQVTLRRAAKEDMDEIEPYLSEYCELFGTNMNDILDARFTVVTPDSQNPYKQLYVAN